MTAFILLVLIILAINIGYGSWIRHRANAWEAAIERDAEGVRLGCQPVSLGPTNGVEAVLLVHGFADSPALWKDLALRLTNAGYAVEALLLPGWMVPRQTAAKIRADDWLQHVETRFQNLARRYSNVWVVAHSMGASIVLRLCDEKRMVPAGVVALAPLLDVGKSRSPLLHPRTWFRISSVLAPGITVIESVYPIDMHDTSLRESIPRDVFLPRSIHAAMFELIEPFRTTLPSLDCPLALAVSQVDQVVDPKAALTFFRSHETAPKVGIETSRAGHVIPLDYGHETLYAFVETFLKNPNRKTWTPPPNSLWTPIKN